MTFWTEDQDAILRAKLADGKTFEQIGRVIGRTKNSCVGRADRLGIKSPKRSHVARKRKPGPVPCRDKVNAFAEALSELGTIAAAAASLGLSHQRGSQLMAQVRADLGWQAYD